MDALEPPLAPVLSLSLHRLQREPRAIHRAFLSRPTLFRPLRNIKSLYHVDGVGFLAHANQVQICISQMLAQAQDSVLVVGPIQVDVFKNLKVRKIASETERLLVIDERVAIIGSKDLAVVLEGPIAKGLSDLFQISLHQPGMNSGVNWVSKGTWPALTRLDLESVEAGLTRTWTSKDAAPIIECERLTLSAIRSARRFIYAEVRSLTSPVIVKALCARLKKEDAPEIVVVLPKGGFLQEAALAKILKADEKEKFRAYEADVEAGLLIVDDQVLKIGSSQWTSRSLGAMRSVDVAIEALGRPTVVMSIARLRRERVGKLLKLEPSEFDARFLLNGSLIKTIESFFTTTRTLNEFTPDATPWTQLAFTFSPILDPKRPQAIKRAFRNRLRFGPKTWRIAFIFATIFALLIMFSTLFAPWGL